MPQKKNRLTEFKHRITEQVDFIELYNELGCPVAGRAGPTGWVPCRSHPSFGGEDRNPSAQFNVSTGVYVDFRNGGESMSFWDFMVKTGHATDFRDAMQKVAERYGFRIPSVSKSHPAHGVQWREWRPNLIRAFCEIKAPITEEGLLRSGAMMCKRFMVPCLVWEIFDDNMFVAGYYFMRSDGQPFEHGDAKGAKSIAKTFPGCSGGFVGKPAVAAMTSGNKNLKVVNWCEGMPDVVAAYSMYPDSIAFFTNPHGTSETVKDAQGKIIASCGADVNFIADADEPGLAGAEKRAREVSRYLSDDDQRSIKIYRPLAFEVATKKGKDLRDLLLENQEKLTSGDVDLDDLLVEHKTEATEATGGGVESYNQALMKHNDEVLSKLSITARGLDGDGGVALVSDITSRMRRLKRISDFSFAEGVMLCGIKFAEQVGQTFEEAEQMGKMQLEDVKMAIAEHVSRTGNATVEMAGNGLWGLGEDKEPYLVSDGRFWRVEKDKVCKVQKGCIHGYLADVDQSTKWFDPDKLSLYMSKASNVEWRTAAYQELESYVGSWHWRHPTMSPIACGLIYISWMQEMLSYRPNILIIGESNCGKTEFMRMLSRLYFDLCDLSGGASAAGVLQNIGSSVAPILIDELDSTGLEQKKILRFLRNTSRGGSILRGTPGQKGVKYRMRHIPWLAGIHMSSDDQADVNRMIELEMLATGGYDLNIPQREVARDLGYKILASVLVCAGDILDNIKEVEQINIKNGKYSRYHESYNVPFATLGTIIDAERDAIAELMTEYFTEHMDKVIAEERIMNDQEALLMEIMTSVIKLPHGAMAQSATVSQILYDPKYMQFMDEIACRGIRLTKCRGREYVATSPRQIVGQYGVLRDCPDWKWNRGVGRVLMRLKSLDPEKNRVLISGVQKHCVCFPYKKLERWIRGQKSDTLFDLE